MLYNQPQGLERCNDVSIHPWRSRSSFLQIGHTHIQAFKPAPNSEMACAPSSARTACLYIYCVYIGFSPICGPFGLPFITVRLRPVVVLDLWNFNERKKDSNFLEPMGPRKDRTSSFCDSSTWWVLDVGLQNLVTPIKGNVNRHQFHLAGSADDVPDPLLLWKYQRPYFRRLMC